MSLKQRNPAIGRVSLFYEKLQRCNAPRLFGCPLIIAFISVHKNPAVKHCGFDRFILS